MTDLFRILVKIFFQNFLEKSFPDRECQSFGDGRVDLVDRVIAEVEPERISKKVEKLIKFYFYQKPDSNKNRINISRKKNC